MNFIPSLFLLILVSSFFGCTRNNFSAEQNTSEASTAKSDLPIQLKEPFPKVPLKTFEGNAVDLTAYKGKVLILNFWASWCVPCLRELPELQTIYETHKNKGLEILAINLDHDPVKKVPPFKKKLKLTFPVLVDPKNDLLELLRIHAIPFNVVIDKNQLVRKIQPGFEDWSSKENKEFIESLIRES